MDWTWARPGTGDLDMASYRDKLAAVCEAMAREGWEVRLIGHSRIAEQSQDDTRVAQQIAQGVKSERVTVSELGGDADRVREGFASADVVIGTRLHSCLIALEAGTPAIALVYQPKTQGTYELLGLDEYCFDVETFRAEEVTALASAVSDSVRREAFAAAARGSRKKLAETYSELLRLSSARLDLAYGVREKGAA
jgi:colanic acid/amylovoran biosynthesis protein